MPNYSSWAPTTGRSANKLSRAYGFSSPREMAGSLPPNARIADFGAGKSKLGHVITDMRDDIHWLNVDIHTGLLRFAQNRQRKSGPGLQYVKASVLQPPIAPGSLDRVYASWLLPHLVLESHNIALHAIHRMAQLLNEDGEMKVCAPNDFGHNFKEYTLTAADYAIAPDEAAASVMEASTLGPVESLITRCNNTLRFLAGLGMLP